MSPLQKEIEESILLTEKERRYLEHVLKSLYPYTLFDGSIADVDIKLDYKLVEALKGGVEEYDYSLAIYTPHDRYEHLCISLGKVEKNLNQPATSNTPKP